MKVEVDVPDSPYGFSGRKATLTLNTVERETDRQTDRQTNRDRQTDRDRQTETELRTCVNVEVDLLGSPSLTLNQSLRFLWT